MLKKFWIWCRQSATIVVARGQLIAGALIEILNEVALLAGGANAAQFLPPRWLPFYLFASGVITELARRRTLVKENA